MDSEEKKKQLMIHLGYNNIRFLFKELFFKKGQLEGALKKISCIQQIAEINLEMGKVEAGIKELLDMLLDDKVKCRCKPLLAKYRDEFWFSVGGRLVCLVGGRFFPAELASFGTSSDGSLMLLVNYGKDIFVEGYIVNQYGDYPLNSPRVMQRWEYEYFRKHPRFAKTWISEYGEEEANAFLKALKREG